MIDAAAALVRERRRTREVLGALTDDLLSWRACDGQRSIGEMAWHLVTGQVAIGGLLGWSPSGPSKDAAPPGSTEAIIRNYDLVGASLERQLEACSESEWRETVDVYGQRWTRRELFRTLLDHEIHHRGGMVVLMRQAGLSPPRIYG